MEEINTKPEELGATTTTPAAAATADDSTTAAVTTNNLITVSIKQLDGSIFGISIAPNAMVRDLKLAIQRERGLAVERQRLIYRAQELRDDNNLLTDYGIVHNSTLHIVIRPLNAMPPPTHSPRDAIINIPQNQVGGYADAPYMDNPNGEGALIDASYHPDINVLYIVKLCRFIRIFAIMDFIFLLLFGLTLSALFFLMAGLALAGYYGAKILKRGYLIAYMICLILEIAARGYFLYADNSNTLSIVLFILMICVELFVLRCVLQLYKAIGLMDAPTRQRIMALNRTVF